MRVLMAPDWRQKNPYLDLLANALRQENVEVVFPRGYRRVLPLWRTVRSQGPIDILHLHWQEAYAHSASCVAQFILGFRLFLDLGLVKAGGHRIVWTLHNEVPHDTRCPQVQRLIQRLILRQADAVITHSRRGLDVLARLDSNSKVPSRVIPHGGYREHYGRPVSKAEARRELGLPEKPRLFLFFGLICPYKGVDLLLKAWRALGSQTAGGHLLIAGEPETAAYGRHIEALAGGLANLDLRLEYIPDSAVRYYFSAADCAVFPFRRILTSGSLTLAKSYGLPVIVPNHPSLTNELDGNEALFFEAGSAASLSQVLESVMRDGHMPQASPVCPGWKEIAQATAEVYRAVAGKELRATPSHEALTRL